MCSIKMFEDIWAIRVVLMFSIKMGIKGLQVISRGGEKELFGWVVKNRYHLGVLKLLFWPMAVGSRYLPVPTTTTMAAVFLSWPLGFMQTPKRSFQMGSHSLCE